MATSMWELTRMVLGAPGSDVAALTEAHGFTPAQVADLLPLFLDNVGVDWAAGPPPALGPPVAGAGEGADDVAARWLADLGAQLHDPAAGLDVVSFDGFGAPEFDLGDFDPGLDPDFAPPAPADGFAQVTTVDEGPTFGHGGVQHGPSDIVHDLGDPADPEDPAGHGYQPAEHVPTDQPDVAAPGDDTLPDVHHDVDPQHGDPFDVDHGGHLDFG